MGLVLSFFAFVLRRFRGDESNTGSKFDIKDGITLFDSGLSPCARRVRMTLIEKGAIYHKGIAECTLFESNVISEFLDRVLPGACTYPTDPWERAQVKMWQDWELAWADDFWPVFYVNVMGFVTRMMYGREKYLASLSPNLSVFQRNRNIRLVINSAQLTSILPRIMMFTPGGMPITEADFPNVWRYMENLQRRKCFVGSQPLMAKLSMLLLKVATPLIVFLGNLRAGKTYTRVVGGKLVARAKTELAEIIVPGGLELSSFTENEVVVFEYPTAAECWQVKLLLNEKEVPYKIVPCEPLDVIGRPMGVGGLFRIQHGRRVVTGSRALMGYIDYNKGLFPDDPLMRARVQCWQAWEQNMSSNEMSTEIHMTILSKLLHSRFSHDNIDELLNLRSDPKYSDNFCHIMTSFMTSVVPGSALWERLKSDYGHLAESVETRRQKADNCCSSLHERLLQA